MDSSVALVLSICCVAFSVFPWQPILFRRPNSSVSLSPLLFLTLSSVLQIAFIVLVGAHFLTLDYSIRFAALGLPSGILALILAKRRSRQIDLPCGTVTCIVLGLLMWGFLITVH